MKKILLTIIIVWYASFFILSSTANASNILLNSSFELWLDSVGIRIPFGWYTSEPQDSGSATRTTDMHSGIYAVKLTGSDTSAYATTLSICVPGRYYYFSAWSKSTSLIAGSFIITWLKLSQQPVTDPVIIPIFWNTSYHNYTQMLQAPDSTVLVNVSIVTLPYITIFIDDVTLSDTVLSGVEENRFPLSTDPTRLKIYPNPASHILWVNYPYDIKSIEFFDIAGNWVKTIRLPGIKNRAVDISELKAGVYFLQLRTEDKKIVQKFIVKR